MVRAKATCDDCSYVWCHPQVAMWGITVFGMTHHFGFCFRSVSEAVVVFYITEARLDDRAVWLCLTSVCTDYRGAGDVAQSQHCSVCLCFTSLPLVLIMISGLVSSVEVHSELQVWLFRLSADYLWIWQNFRTCVYEAVFSP